MFPVFAVYWSKILFVMQPIPGEDRINFDKIRTYSYIMIGISFGSFIFTFCGKIIFGFMGENMTKNIRQKLYESFLRKHIGWFDKKDNSAGNLTSVLATETQTLNGVSTEAVGTTLEAIFGLVVGIGIGFGFNWKISLVALAASPLMIIGGYVNAATNKGLSNAQEKNYKNANILVSDSIINYLTVQSFGNNEMIV